MPRGEYGWILGGLYAVAVVGALAYGGSKIVDTVIGKAEEMASRPVPERFQRTIDRNQRIRDLLGEGKDLEDRTETTSE